MSRQFKPGQLRTGSLYDISASYASYAVTASYALNGGDGGGGGTGAGFPFSGSAVITGSLLVSGSGFIVTGSLNAASITGSLRGTASWAQNYTETDPIFTKIGRAHV